MSQMQKRTAGIALALASAALLAACATMKVNSFTERGANLRQYRSYAWGPADKFSTGDPRLDNNRFFDERVRARVEKELAQRGFEKSNTADPDVLVHYHTNVSQDIDVRDLDSPSSYCAQNDCRPFIYDKGTLFVDLVDRRTAKLVWRGWAEGSFDGVIDNQSWMESRIDEAVTKILTRLPRL